MGTYAHYRVWVGVQLVDIPSADNNTVDQILESSDSIEINGLAVTAFGMHGAQVGIGVEVLDFEWETVETGPSEFDIALYEKARNLVSKVNNALRSIGILVDSKIYHHIDLGG